MKKILFVNSSLDSGGSERVMSLIANGFSEKDYNVTMALLRDKNRVYSVNNNVDVVQFKYKSLNKIRIFFSRFFQYRKLLKKIKPDVIISFMWDINIFTLISSIGYKSKIIISERAHPKMGTQNFVRKFGQKYLYMLADKVVLQTEYVKQFFPKQIQKKCFIIPNPINKNIPNSFNGERKKVIVAVGRLTKQKNFSLLIDAFFEFHKQKKDYILEIYGEGPLKNELQDMINNYYLNESVFLKGYVDDVDEKMRTASIYVSSSDFEGISNSMLEALAMGIPSICTDCPVGGARLMIKNNVNGILIPVGDKQALVEAMEKIVSDSEFASKISKESLKIRKEYSIDKIVKKWEDIL